MQRYKKSKRFYYYFEKNFKTMQKIRSLELIPRLMFEWF